jgi:dTDP-glucose pyrophosphorylase
VKNWRDTLVHLGMSIVDVMKAIDSSAAKIVLVLDENEHLVGTATDGDIRRGLLRGNTLESPLSEVLHRTPFKAPINASNEQILAIMERELIRQIPLVDSEGKVTGLAIKDELKHALETKRDTRVILMVGGQGQRLRPLTEDIPKPMLSIGDKPLLESILENLIEQNFHHFCFSVNYKADSIVKHFGDGSNWGVEIKYLHENKQMGTAGALSLLQEQPPEPFIVMNGDLLTKVNFGHLLDYHNSTKADVTMGVREYDVEIDYGVVEISEGRITKLKEKPIHQFLVNGGIYVLNPFVFDYISKSEYLDMTTLFQHLIDTDKFCSVFPIVEYWLDIGQIKDLEHARRAVTTV